MTTEETSEAKNRRSYVSSLPSDYSDVQPRNYDPDFISAISNQMQVPESIPVLNGNGSEYSMMRNEDWRGTDGGMNNPQRMNVPEKIMLAGGGRHIGGKPDIRSLNFDDVTGGSFPDIVDLQTPPRTLTLDEQFPSLEPEEDEEEEDENTNARLPNGGSMVRQYTPTRDDSLPLSLTDDESTQLKLQLVRLSKRLNNLERQQQVQENREWAMVGVGVSYVVFKFLFWFFRGK